MGKIVYEEKIIFCGRKCKLVLMEIQKPKKWNPGGWHKKQAVFLVPKLIIDDKDNFIKWKIPEKNDS